MKILVERDVLKDIMEYVTFARRYCEDPSVVRHYTRNIQQLLTNIIGDDNTCESKEEKSSGMLVANRKDIDNARNCLSKIRQYVTKDWCERITIKDLVIEADDSLRKIFRDNPEPNPIFDANDRQLEKDIMEEVRESLKNDPGEIKLGHTHNPSEYRDVNRQAIVEILDMLIEHGQEHVGAASRIGWTLPSLSKAEELKAKLVGDE
jgi:hypothetical protein